MNLKAVSENSNIFNHKEFAWTILWKNCWTYSKNGSMEKLKMETEKLRAIFKEWAKENGLLLIRLTSGQYNSPKTEAAWKAFQAASKLTHGKSTW